MAVQHADPRLGTEAETRSLGPRAGVRVPRSIGRVTGFFSTGMTWSHSCQEGPSGVQG